MFFFLTYWHISQASLSGAHEISIYNLFLESINILSTSLPRAHSNILLI